MKTEIIIRLSPECTTCGKKVGWWTGSRSPHIKDGTWQFGRDYFCSEACMNKYEKT